MTIATDRFAMHDDSYSSLNRLLIKAVGLVLFVAAIHTISFNTPVLAEPATSNSVEAEPIQSHPLVKPGDASPSIVQSGQGNWLISTALVIVVVLGAAFLTWWSHRLQGKRLNQQSDIQLEVSGRQFLDAQTSLYTVRFGGKILLIGRCAGTITTLAERSCESPDKASVPQVPSSDSGSGTQRTTSSRIA